MALAPKPASEWRPLLVEFIVVAGVVVAALVCVMALAITSHDASPVTGTLTDVVKTGFGALLALAYAAGRTRPDGGGK